MARKRSLSSQSCFKAGRITDNVEAVASGKPEADRLAAPRNVPGGRALGKARVWREAVGRWTMKGRVGSRLRGADDTTSTVDKRGCQSGESRFRGDG